MKIFCFPFALLLILYPPIAGICALAPVERTEKGDADSRLWPQYRHDPGLSGHSPLKGGLAKPPSERWSVDLGGTTQPVEQIRIEDLNDDRQREVLRILSDRIICQDLHGKKIWEADDLPHPSVVDIRDYAGNGKLGILVNCWTGVASRQFMIDGATGAKALLYKSQDNFGGHNRKGHILPGVPGEQLCVWWDGENPDDRNVGGLNMYGYGYLWSFEKGVSKPTLRFQSQTHGLIYSGQHMFVDMDGDGKDEFIVIGEAHAWLFDPQTGKLKTTLIWEPFIRYYTAEIAALPLKKGERPSFISINPHLPGVEVVHQDGKTTATRLWKVVVGGTESQYQSIVKITHGAPDPFTDLDGDGVYEIATAITNEHGDGATNLAIFNSLDGKRLFDQPNLSILTVDDLDGDGKSEILLKEGDTLKIANWNGKEFVARWSEQKIAPLLIPAPLEGQLNRSTEVGVNCPLWRETKGSNHFLMRFSDGVFACEFEKGGSLKKLNAISQHEALNNLPQTNPPLDNFTFDGKTIITLEDGKEVARYEVPQRRVYQAPSPIVGRLDGQTRIIDRDADGSLISLAPDGSDKRVLVRQNPGHGVANHVLSDFFFGELCDLDGDGKNELIASTADGGNAIVAVDGQGKIKLRIPAVEGATEWVLGPTGRLGSSVADGRWISARFRKQFEPSALAVYDGKTGREMWVRTNYPPSLDKEHGGIFALHIPTAVYDYNHDGADDLLAACENAYGIVDMKNNKDLVTVERFTNTITLHWPAYSTPMLAHFTDAANPQVLFSRGYSVVFTSELTGKPFWHYGVRRSETPKSQAGLADLDGDGKTDVVVSQPDGFLRAFGSDPVNQKCPSCPTSETLTENNHAGRPRWTSQLPPPVSDFTAADLDGDGKDELLCGAGDGKLYALKEKKGACTVLWSVKLSDQSVGAPILIDSKEGNQHQILAPTEDGRLHCLVAP